MNNYWIELRNIDIYYEKDKIINNINLKLLSGENTVIIGENGSGKSTLLKVIAKLKYPRAKDNSYIRHFGSSKINIWDLRQKIAFVLSEIDTRIKKTMLTSDVILSGYQGTFGLLNNKRVSSQHIVNLTKIKSLLGIQSISKYYSDLSDGEKRKVLIARSIINNPKVLILDEPTNRLDLKSKYELKNTLSELAKNGITLLYVTHSIENIINEINRVIFIKAGEIILDGKPELLINSKNMSKVYDYNVDVRKIRGNWISFPGK